MPTKRKQKKGRVKGRRKGTKSRKKLSEKQVKIALDRLKPITQKKKIQEVLKRQKKSKIRLFGELGKRIKKSDIPETPNVHYNTKDPISKDSSKLPKKVSKRKRPIYGFVATVRGAYLSKGRKEVFVNKRGLFLNPSRNLSPITVDSAKKRVSEFVADLERKYRGRISLIDIEVKPIIDRPR